MSLLMDALNRAEPSKQTAARELMAEEPHASTTTDFNRTPINGEQPARPATEEESRAAIKNAFAAKTTSTSSRKFLAITLGVLGTATIATSIYVWAPLQGADQEAMAVSHRQPDPLAEVRLAPERQPAMSVFAPNPASTASVAEAPPRTRSIPGVPAEPQEFPPLRLSKSSPESDTHLQRGYRNFQESSLTQAHQEYQQALDSDPNNVDTLLGLAVIAQRQGRPTDAERYRQRALEADPRDPAAQAAVLGGANGGNPTDTESRLKSILSAQPESAPLNFALGNLYARQARWNEAQQVYFNAVAGDTENPDYLFNLAVSLDQMHQPKLAAQHYRLALEAGERRPAAFDRQRVRQRLNQLPQ